MCDQSIIDEITKECTIRGWAVSQNLFRLVAVVLFAALSLKSVLSTKKEDLGLSCSVYGQFQGYDSVCFQRTERRQGKE